MNRERVRRNHQSERVNRITSHDYLNHRAIFTDHALEGENEGRYRGQDENKCKKTYSFINTKIEETQRPLLQYMKQNPSIRSINLGSIHNPTCLAIVSLQTPPLQKFDPYFSKRSARNSTERQRNEREINKEYGTGKSTITRGSKKREEALTEAKLTPKRPTRPEFKIGFKKWDGKVLTEPEDLWVAKITGQIRPSWNKELRDAVVNQAPSMTDTHGTVLREAVHNNIGDCQFYPSKTDHHANPKLYATHYQVGHVPGWAKRVAELPQHRYFVEWQEKIYVIKAWSYKQIQLVFNDPKFLRLEEAVYNETEGKNQKNADMESLRDGLQDWVGDKEIGLPKEITRSASIGIKEKDREQVDMEAIEERINALTKG
jgi:hypothetical protein